MANGDEGGAAWRWFAVVISIVALVIALAAVGVVAAEDDDGGDGEGDGGGADSSDVAAAGPTITMGEFWYDGDLTVEAATSANVVNEGAAAHNLTVEDTELATPDVGAGESTTLDLSSLDAGTYTIFCSIPGHREAGMEAELTVAQEGAAVSHGGDAGGEPDWEALDTAMTESILAFPAETEGRGNQPLEPNVLADGTKEFELTVAITPWEVEPGRIVDAWTYNGQVPGPQIKVDVGDNVRVIVHNELPMGTDVHWHGIDTPFEMDGVAPITQELIESGEDFVYEFVARDLSVGMYHAHHHAQMQVPNGLFGVFQIGDVPLPAGETISGVTIPADITIAEEIPMVLNDAGVIGFSLNGKSFPATDPYAVSSGDWLMVHYYNEGLLVHPMHQHQFNQLVIAKDGIPLEQPYWADTINVAPGERYTIIMNPNEAGTWVWHCHILNHVEREEGMFGMVTALVVTDEAAA